MTSWRDTVTEQAQQDVDGLTTAAVDFAIEGIQAAGDFRPFALAVSVDGEHQVITPGPAAAAEVTVAEQLAAHWRAVTDVKDSLRAAADALNVALPERQCDGIEVSVEHRDGAATGLIFAYTLGAEGAVNLASPTEHPMNPRIWGTGS